MYARTVANPVSRFVGEIPEALVDRRDLSEDDGIYGGGMYGSARGQKTYHFGDGSSDRTGGAGGGYSDRRRPFTEREQATVNKPLMENGVHLGGKPTFREGDRVHHATFGDGEILSVKAMGADVLYEIMFDTAGTKKLMATYAKLRRAD